MEKDMSRSEALARQGDALLEIARTKQGKQADELFKAADNALTLVSSMFLQVGWFQLLGGLRFLSAGPVW